MTMMWGIPLLACGVATDADANKWTFNWVKFIINKIRRSETRCRPSVVPLPPSLLRPFLPSSHERVTRNPASLFVLFVPLFSPSDFSPD